MQSSIHTSIDVTAPAFGQYAGPSSMSFTDAHGFTYYFSYQTLVAVSDGHGWRIVLRNTWGVTTGKHLNAIDGGDKSARLDRESFCAALVSRLSNAR